jgi:uncharacterized membrane protein YkoI
MKLNRFLALAGIALLVVGAMGTIAGRTFAQTPVTQPQQVQATEAPGSLEPASGTDTDHVDEQVGDQNTLDSGPEANDAEGAETGDGADAVPSGTPAITAAAAQQTAEAYLNAGSATRTELDDENGQLVYSVEIGGTDVKVDAMTGAVLSADSTGD